MERTSPVALSGVVAYFHQRTPVPFDAVNPFRAGIIPGEGGPIIYDGERDERIGMTMVKRVAAAAVALFALLGFAGCQVSERGSVAAIADGVTITQRQVDQTVAKLTGLTLLQSIPTQALPAFATQFLVWGTAGTSITQALGLPITDDLRQQVIDQSQLTQEYQDTTLRPFLMGLVDFTVVMTTINQGGIDQASWMRAISSVPVTVNPRYGTWDVPSATVTSYATVLSGGDIAGLGSLADGVQFDASGFPAAS